MEDLRALGFDLVGYGCTTCIGNSGPLPEPVAQAIDEHQLVAAAVLSGNRNFEGRVHPAGQGELPRLAAAGGRLRARRQPQGRPHERAARHRQRRQAGLSARHLADAGRRPGGDPQRRRPHVQERLRRRLQGRRALGEDRRPGERGLRLGRRQHLRQAAALLPGHDARARGDRGHPGRARARDARRQHHDRPHLAGRLDRAEGADRRLLHGAPGPPAGLQLLRLAPRQSRGDDARHLRQHPPAQRGGARAPRAAGRG